MGIDSRTGFLFADLGSEINGFTNLFLLIFVATKVMVDNHLKKVIQSFLVIFQQISGFFGSFEIVSRSESVFFNRCTSKLKV